MSKIKDKYLVETYAKTSTYDTREQTAFSYANNQATPATILTLAGTERAAKVTVAVEVSYDSGASFAYELHELMLLQRTGGWDIQDSFIQASNPANTTGVEFSMTASHQLQYTSPNLTNFVEGNFIYRVRTFTSQL